MLKNINFYFSNDTAQLKRLMYEGGEIGDYISYFPESGRSYAELIEHFENYYGIPSNLNKLSVDYNLAILTHSELLFTYFQRLIAEEKLDFKIVNVYYLDQYVDLLDSASFTKISIDKFGECSSWPLGFFEETLTEFTKLLTARKVAKNKNNEIVDEIKK